MGDGWMVVLAGLGGAAIGGGSAIASAWMLQRNERRREFVRLAFQAAIEDHKFAREDAIRSAGAGKPTRVPPLLVYLFHHWRIADLIYSGTFDSESLEGVIREQEKLLKVVDTINPPVRSHVRSESDAQAGR